MKHKSKHKTSKREEKYNIVFNDKETRRKLY